MSLVIKRHRGDIPELNVGMREHVLEHAVLIAQETFSIEPNPKSPFSIGNKAPHWPDQRSIGNWLLHHDKAISVKSDEATIRTNPQVSIFRLSDGVNLTPEQALFRPPFLVKVLRE